MLAVRGPSMRIEFELGGLVFIGAAILALGWIWLFLARTGVELSNEGLTVRNWLRTYEIPWQDVSGFAFGDNVNNLSIRESIATPAIQTYVLTTDGHHRVMSGLQASHVRRSRSAVQLLLDSLELERAKHLITSS
jgi:hypothetical protein